MPEGNRLDRLADEWLELRPRDVRPSELVAELFDQLLRFGPELAGVRECFSNLVDVDVSREPARERLNEIRAR